MPDQFSGVEREPREHRAGAWVLLVVGLAALGLGMYQWRGGIVKAFDRGPSKFKSLEQLEQEKLDELKTKDTDGDGLSDFDEIHVFGTSPYLADSDSDGISDKEELERGTDPNCPEDRECGPLGTDPFSNLGETEPRPAVGELEAPDLQIIEALLNPSAAQIRQMLLETGVDPEELRLIDDATLLDLYRESLKEAQSP